MLLLKYEGAHVFPVAFFPTVEAMCLSISIGMYNDPFFAHGRDSGRVASACTPTAAPSVAASASPRIPSSSLDEGTPPIVSGLLTFLLAWRFLVPQKHSRFLGGIWVLVCFQ